MRALFKHLPNFLTGLRLVSAPAVVLFLFDGNDRAAFGIFALAGLSDAVDGFLAKRFGFVTRVGRYLDPAADKLLIVTSFVALSMMHMAPLWITGIVLGRDLAIVLGVLVVAWFELPVPVKPLFVGKISTACQIGYVAFALLLRSTGKDWPHALTWAAIIAAVATGVSWIGYGSLLARAIAARLRGKTARPGM